MFAKRFQELIVIICTRPEIEAPIEEQTLQYQFACIAC